MESTSSGTAGTSEVQTTSGNLDFYVNTSPQSSPDNSPRIYSGFQNFCTPFFPQNQSTPQLNLPPLYQLSQNTSTAPETTFQNQTYGMQSIGQSNPVLTEPTPSHAKSTPDSTANSAFSKPVSTVSSAPSSASTATEHHPSTTYSTTTSYSA
ncbi:unnamed protein product [Cuscuta epithymum]|nr:unnamed protein product [Cuscuta epithymum]